MTHPQHHQPSLQSTIRNFIGQRKLFIGGDSGFRLKDPLFLTFDTRFIFFGSAAFLVDSDIIVKRFNTP